MMADPTILGSVRFAVLTGAPGSSTASRSWQQAVLLDESRLAVTVGLVPARADEGLAPRLRDTAIGRLAAGGSPGSALAEVEAVVRRDLLPASAPPPAALCAVLHADGDGAALWWAATPGLRPLVWGPVTHEPDDAAPAGGTRGEAAGTSGLAAGTSVVLTATEVAGGLDVADAGLPLSGQARVLAGRSARPEDPFVLVRVTPGPLAARLAAEPAVVPRLRRTVGAWAARSGLDEDDQDDLLLTLSEAATNAVEHAYCDAPRGEFTCAVRHGVHGVVVEVQDFGRWRPPSDPGYRGRGIALIRRLAHDVSLDGTDRGTCIRFTVGGPAQSRAATAMPGADVDADTEARRPD